LRTLHHWGIRTPFVYGYGCGTIYRRYLLGDWQTDLAGLQSGCMIVKKQRRYLRQLGHIAATLDLRGAHPLDFVSDLWTDATGRLYYIDSGSDLGDIKRTAPPNAQQPAKKSLETNFGFPLLADLEEWYEACYTRMSALIQRRRR
jgi:hypothetical protein